MKIEFDLLITQNPIIYAFSRHANPVELVMMEMQEFQASGVVEVKASENFIEMKAANGQANIYRTPYELKLWMQKYDKEGVKTGPFNGTVCLEHLASISPKGDE